MVVIEKLTDVPAGTDVFRASGLITRGDYDAVVAPRIQAAAREGRRLRCLCEVSHFGAMTPAAAWEDIKLAPRAVRMMDGCAVVSDIGWIRRASWLASFVLPRPVRVYERRDREQALSWLGSLPQGPGVAQRLDTELGVVMIELAAPLRTADFAALALTVDRWLQAHSELSGLVVHARAFPGWQNIAALIRHVRFVRDHHHKIGKVALAVNGPLAATDPGVGQYVVHPEVRGFGYAELGREQQ